MMMNRILLGAGLLLSLGAAPAMAETINGCNLQPGTQCPGANLRNAQINGADLSRANLSGADLTGATWSDGRKCGDNSIGMCRQALSGADLVKLLQGLPATQQDLVLQHYPQLDAA